MIADINSPLTTFVDDDARIRYAVRVAEMVAEAMRSDQRAAVDILMRGRIGLAQM